MYCSIDCARPTRSTGHGRLSTALRYALFLGGANRPEPHGSQEKRLEAPYHHRCEWCSARHHSYRREPARRNPASAAGSCDSAHLRSARTAPSTSRSCSRRSSLSFEPASRCAHATGHRARTGAPWNRSRQRTRRVPMGRRTNLVVVASVPPPPHSV